MSGYESIGMAWSWLWMILGWLVPIILAALFIHHFTEPPRAPPGPGRAPRR